MQVTIKQYIAWRFVEATLKKLGHSNVDLEEVIVHNENNPVGEKFFTVTVVSDGKKIRAEGQLWGTQVSGDGILGIECKFGQFWEGSVDVQERKSFCQILAKSGTLQVQADLKPPNDKNKEYSISPIWVLEEISRKKL